MTILNTKQISVPQHAPPSPPNLLVQFVKPVSYEFRVVEHMDVETNKIIKVCLQVQTYEHDEWGNGTIKNIWADVPRVQVDVKTGVIITK